LSFGKWIFASSVIYFLSSNFDRLYLAKAISLGLLGVFGIARSISELLSNFVGQLGNNVIFPIVASHSHIASIRGRFMFAACFGISLLAATADLVIRLLYDQRYQAAGWMLPVLIVGAWFAIMASINESTLLGIGKPQYSSLASSVKFGFLLVGLPWSVARHGILGGVMVVAISDLWRYVPLLIGQVRERFSFGRQDALATLGLFGLIVFWEWLRWSLGFGTSLESFPAGAFRAVWG
jgi:O-antigen/teichoic acid export membrane protein